MALYPRSEPDTDAYAASRALFDTVITRLSDPQMAERPEHVVEEFIAGSGRDVLLQALQDHLDARAAAEPRRSEVTRADQVVRRRAEPGHTRLLATTLGRVEVSRIAYRAPAVSNLHPADARLALPDGGYSFPLQKAVVHETVTGALREARDGLARILGQRVGTRQLMQITVGAARDVRDFYPQHRVPAPATRAGGESGPRDLLVLSIDATGINMIDSGLRPPPTGQPDRCLLRGSNWGRTRTRRPPGRTAKDEETGAPWGVMSNPVSILYMRSAFDDRTAKAVIRDEALDLFARFGPDAVTVRRIAAAAGVSPALVVHHFGSKEGLRQAVDERVALVFDELFGAVTVDPAAFDWATVETDASLAALVLGRLPPDSPIPAYLRRLWLAGDEAGAALFRKWYDASVAMLDALQSAGVLTGSADPPMRAAFVMVNDLAVLLLRDQLTAALGVDPLGPDGLRRWLGEAMAVYRDGLFAGPAPD